MPLLKVQEPGKSNSGICAEGWTPVLCGQDPWRCQAHRSSGASFEAMARRTAYYVDRILKGTAPADLSVGWSDKFEFIVNLKVVAPAHRDRRDWTTAY